ncbi:Protein of unknown function DUF889 domain containing protein [Tropilaelaps mercedesae]|uniref:STPR domain-containing protein n=1 Tax=Tropilaelaps mercedesae TaxID=418985 RepID=A0A1V9XZS6_9ACAR|nr:Protein of unknown function DUF889 domain containing protein [Tropilaelaps mercedesae]
MHPEEVPTEITQLASPSTSPCVQMPPVFGMSHRTIRRKIVQMNESEEDRKMRLEADARRKRLRRANESLNERQQRLAAAAERQRARRANETTAERLRRLANDAERQRERRANESPVDRQRRLALDAERQRERRAKESSVERQHRLAVDAERQRERRANESAAERQKRLLLDSERHMERRINGPSVTEVEERQRLQQQPQELQQSQEVEPDPEQQRVVEASDETGQLIELKYKVTMADVNPGEPIKGTSELCAMTSACAGVPENCGEVIVKAEYSPELQYLYEDYSKISGLNRRPVQLAWHQYHTIHVRAIQVPTLSTNSMTTDCTAHVVTVPSASAMPLDDHGAGTALVIKHHSTEMISQEEHQDHEKHLTVRNC